MNHQLPKQKYHPGQKVAYFGFYKELVGKLFTIEDGVRYLPNNEPPGYYYDLAYHGLKRVHESELTAVETN